MFDIDTRSLTLRSFSQRTIEMLYRLKALTGKPVCRLVDEIVSEYFERDANLPEQIRQVEESDTNFDQVMHKLQIALTSLKNDQRSPGE